MVELSQDGHRDLVSQLAHQPGGVWVTCIGRSMEPTIWLGDQVRVEACDRPRAGDVVLLEAGCGYILHRLIARVPGTDWLLHIGDSPACVQPSLARLSRVMGRADVPRRAPDARVMSLSLLRLAAAARAVIRRRARGQPW